MCSSSSALATQKGDKAQIRNKRDRTVSRRFTNACKECSMQKTLEIGARLACPAQPSPGRQTWGMCEKNPHRKSNFEFTVTKLHPHQEPGGSEISTQPKLYHPGATRPPRKCKCTTQVRTEQMKRKAIPFPKIHPPYTCVFWLKKTEAEYVPILLISISWVEAWRGELVCFMGCF